VLAAQCLDRRISDKQTIVDQVNAWTKSRNAANGGADWRFTTAEARISGQLYQNPQHGGFGRRHCRPASSTSRCNHASPPAQLW
jgi:hypothetical protein